MNKRVVVTGVGMVSPLGNDVTSTWGKIKEGQSGIGLLTKLDANLFDVKIAAEVKDFDPSAILDRKDQRKMDLFTQYAVVAAMEAITDAKLLITQENAERVGTWIGSGIGGITTFEEQFQNFERKGAGRVSPFFIPMLIPDMAAAQVSIMVGAQGINSCSVTACASGTNSIGDAFRVIQKGDADVMIAGGTEAPITKMGVAGFMNMTALSKNPDSETACRPFDKDRDGFVIGEGAGILILEELEHANRRGAKIYAELVGYGATGDAYHITSPNPDGEGSARALLQAIHEANLQVQDVDYINAHGTSTPLNEKMETAAIKKAFAEHASRVAISSTKSMTGHMLGAAGAVEAIFSVLAICESIIPPTINYRTPDEECDLDFVPNEARHQEVDVALSNSLGFGGHNACLVFKKYVGDEKHRS